MRVAGHKGWVPAFRDATLFKVAYSFGLRRNEVRMLDSTDLGRNPHALEFGEHGPVARRAAGQCEGSQLPPGGRYVSG